MRRRMKSVAGQKLRTGVEALPPVIGVGYATRADDDAGDVLGEL